MYPHFDKLFQNSNEVFEKVLILNIVWSLWQKNEEDQLMEVVKQLLLLIFLKLLNVLTIGY